jgi:ketosteroid isomerase-like protein
VRRADIAGGKGNPGPRSEDLPRYEKMWTAFIKTGGGVESVPLSDIHVRIDPSGNTALASSRLRVKARSDKGVVSDENFQESDIWFKRNGE